MSSSADRFTRLQKVAIFLVALGEEKARQLLTELDLETVEKVNAAILGLGQVTPQERVAVMIEFGDFFYKGKALKAKLTEAPDRPRRAASRRAPPAAPPTTARSAPASPPTPPPAKPAKGFSAPFAPPSPKPAADDQVARQTLRHLRRRVDPGQIDWGRAGYDFGEGFKGPSSGRG
ncbi:MAG: hypothetical protein WDA75_04980 [Candidatus Latescibacterota bacterium]|jgi:hypothetical protein